MVLIILVAQIGKLNDVEIKEEGEEELLFGWRFLIGLP